MTVADHPVRSTVHPGARFGRLVLVEEALPGLWMARCDCGGWWPLVHAQNLRTGATRSCGCWRREHCREIGKGTLTADPPQQRPPAT